VDAQMSFKLPVKLEFLGCPFFNFIFWQNIFSTKPLAPTIQIAFPSFSTCCLAFDNEDIGRGKEGRVLNL
jgi:hypothetical protein